MSYDVAIIGAGMAGASLAYFLAPHARVVLIEGEPQPGYHTTGRSAAFFAETYGGLAVQPLSTASLPFFLSPPEGFSDAPLLAPRGCLHVGSLSALAAIEAAFTGSPVALHRLGPEATAAYCPQLRSEWREQGLWEPDCRDIDVAALHQGFLAGARRAGAELLCDAPVNALARSGCWRIDTSLGPVEAEIVVDAAGAWGDSLAALAGVQPVGLQPMRRTVVVADVVPSPSPDLPLVMDASGNFYFKPDAGRLWISPHDETPAPPSDVQPEEIDIAVAIDRLETATDFRVRRVERAWAGLRTFAPDRAPVYGFDALVPGFFWCVGQGGFGIQTAPAAGRMAAALLLGRDAGLPGIDPELYSSTRKELGSPT